MSNQNTSWSTTSIHKQIQILTVMSCKGQTVISMQLFKNPLIQQTLSIGMLNQESS